MSCTKNGFGVAFLVAFGLCSTAAQAQQSLSDTPLQLEWHAPADCSGERAIRQGVRELLRYSTGPALADPLIARGTVTKTERGYALELVVSTGGAERARSLEAPSCTEVANAATLILAMVVDPNLEAQAPASEPAPKAVTSGDGASGLKASGPLGAPACPAPPPCAALPAIASAVPPAPRVPKFPGDPAVLLGVAARDTPPCPSWSLQLGAGLSGGVLPELSPSIEVAALWENAPWAGGSVRVELGGRGVMGTGRSENTPRQGAAFILGTTLGRACWLIGGTLAVGPCVGLEVGALRGAGFGITSPSADTQAWLASDFGLLFRLRAGERAGFGLHLAGMVPWRRPVFELAGVEFHRPSVVALGATFGLRIAIL